MVKAVSTMPQNFEAIDRLASLSQSKKELIFNELIEGNMSMETQQYLRDLLKNDSLDYFTRRAKRAQLMKAVKPKYTGGESQPKGQVHY